jgi:hypothetical protein
MDDHATRLVRTREVLKMLLCLLVACCIWAPGMHLFFKWRASGYRPAAGISTPAREVAAAQTEIWSNPKLRVSELRSLRAINPEWDFMGRTYLVLSLANMALRDESYRRSACASIDAVLEDTLRHERQQGFRYFLLSYGCHGGWTIKPGRSIFVDGEIALMLAARRMAEEKPAYKPLLQERVNRMIKQMTAGPLLSAESYPDECWIFCNTIALAAIRMADVLDGTDHSAFLSNWVRTAKAKLIDHKTGLLISAFSVYGEPAACGSGGEGSSIWMACHMLQIIDPTFAKQQYRLARKALGTGALGFGFAREWPRNSSGGQDIDSGPMALDVSPSSTALAAVAAGAFDDEKYLNSIFASIELGALPASHGGRLRYCLSNRVGDAVLLYAMTEGPLWNAVRTRSHQW